MLTVRWEAPNGKVWNLTTGAQGVKLDMNNSRSLFSCWENMVRLVVGRTLFFVSH